MLLHQSQGREGLRKEGLPSAVREGGLKTATGVRHREVTGDFRESWFGGLGAKAKMSGR